MWQIFTWNDKAFQATITLPPGWREELEQKHHPLKLFWCIFPILLTLTLVCMRLTNPRDLVLSIFFTYILLLTYTSNARDFPTKDTIHCPCDSSLPHFLHHPHFSQIMSPIIISSPSTDPITSKVLLKVVSTISPRASPLLLVYFIEVYSFSVSTFFSPGCWIGFSVTIRTSLIWANPTDGGRYGFGFQAFPLAFFLTSFLQSSPEWPRALQGEHIVGFHS